MLHLTPEIVLRAYGRGLFPMAEGRHDRRLYWVDPESRGIIPLDRFHVPRRVARRARSGYFDPSEHDAGFTECALTACSPPARLPADDALV